jgi:isopentenyl phosphate kinase
MTANNNQSKKIVIVKLGGAAITNKKGICELAPKIQLEQTLNQIATAYNILKSIEHGHQLVLVHGAGSFGHPQAKEYQLKAGWSSSSVSPSPSYLKGYSHIRACLQQLDHAIVSQLESRNVPVLAMSPIDYIQTTNCEETPTKDFKYMASRVKKYLDLGFVPVLHGDAVLDHIRGCTILSGDIIMYQLTRLLNNVSRCIFITDVAGIYEHDPKTIPTESVNPLISQVFVGDNNDEEEQAEVREHNQGTLADVTGGMQGKIKWAKKIVASSEHNIDTVICKWGSKEALDMMTLQQPTKKCAMTVFTIKK